MKIKINKKKYEIKPSSELTVKEYILFFDGIKEGVNNLEILIRYLSITLGLTYKNVADINIDEKTIKNLFAYIGEIVTPEKIPETKEFYHQKTGKILYQKSVNWRTIGVRRLLEDRKTDNYLEQIVYLLAIYISDDYDNENVEEIYNELQNYNAIDVFGFVIFFFRKLQHGKNSDKNSLKKLLKKVSINIQSLSNK